MEVQICKLGIYGRAYDGPEVRYAYTYGHQPDNLAANKLGRACAYAAKSPGGDWIDQGLSLLFELQKEGFGIYELKGETAPEKYDDTLMPFLKMMRNELHANAGKGDRPAWLQMTPGECLLEIYYHLGKLQKGVKDNDRLWIKEYTADVANMAMMLADICGVLEQ
jgi:hypothetical protein